MTVNKDGVERKVVKITSYFTHSVHSVLILHSVSINILLYDINIV